MNELELIFTLLEEDDIIYNKDLTSQKKSRLATNADKQLRYRD